MRVSVVAPARDEAPNVGALVEQVGLALASELESGEAEVIIVDDASTDATPSVATGLGRPWLRVLTMRAPSPGEGNGQSAAFAAGFRAARGDLVATLDADLQNDPADLPRLIALAREHPGALVQGDRSASRRDTLVRRFGSRMGRLARRAILDDPTRDTGCSLRVMPRALALRLPLDLRGMHRFVPVLARDLGHAVIETPVAHRARAAGRTKYGLGLARALPGLRDALAVRYMRSRRRAIEWAEAGAPVERAGTPARADSPEGRS